MNDLRSAFRQLIKSPGFTVVAVLTLALGIGANTAIFSVINALLLNPLPYPESGRIVQVSEVRSNGGLGGADGGVFTDWENATTQFDAIAAVHNIERNVAINGAPIRLSGAEVSAQFLRVLRVRPILGRDFVPAEDAPGGDRHVVILSHELWQSRFQGDPQVVGRVVRMDAETFTVVGVLPPHALLNPNYQFLAPACIRVDEYKLVPNYNYVCGVIGRLKPGARAEQATAELMAARKAVVSRYPSWRQDWSISMQTLQEATYGGSRPIAFTLLAAVGAILLIACANVANLLLARSAARSGEMAVRAALGASCGRLVRLLLTESLVLAVVGGAVGLLVGVELIRPLVVFTQLDVNAPGLQVRLDGTVMAFAIGITCLTGLIFGLFPALTAARPDLNEELKSSVRGSSPGARQRIQKMLIVAETALTVVLLVCAGLLLRSFFQAYSANVGFQRDHALAFSVSLPGSKVPTIDHRLRFVDEMLRRIREIPGVKFAGVTSSTPLNGRIYFGEFISREDKPATRNDLNAAFDSVAGDYFQALGVPLLRGRFFTDGDGAENAPRVMIINESLARRLFPTEDPIGQLLNWKNATWQVVGVVGDIRQFQVDGPAPLHTYMPLRHFPWSTGVVVRTSVAPLSLADDLRRAVQKVDSEQPIAYVTTLEEAIDASLQSRRITLTLVTLFAIVALALAAIGIYGLMAYSVSRRTREIGIRMALGAGVAGVISLVVRDGVRLVLLGLGIGALAGYGAARLIQGLLYATSSVDPVVFAAVAVVLIGAALLACWLPARRATHVNPVDALRAE
jgi:predicted permease